MEYGILTLTFWLSITVYVQGAGELNDWCRTIRECRSFGYICAKNSTCQCLPSIYVPNKERTKCVGTVGHKCKYDEHCIEGAFCENQTSCKCKDSYNADQAGFCTSSSTKVAVQHLLLPLLILCHLRL